MFDLEIPTEPIGSIPRPLALIESARACEAGEIPRSQLEALYDAAVEETVRLFEQTGSPVITDGEQRKHHNFATYCVDGLENFAPDGFRIEFTGHTRQWPRLTKGPFRYRAHADDYLPEAMRLSRVPVKQAVISPSALSLFYPAAGIPDYPRETFLEDLLREHESEVRRCLLRGAHCVQIDFTEARLACKLDPSRRLLEGFITLNNLALSRLSDEERSRVGIHTCPGGDRDTTHSADIDYSELLPSLFDLYARNFYVALAREPDRLGVLQLIRKHLKPEQRVFVGVIDPLDPQVEDEDEVCARVLEAAAVIPLHQLGTTDDCGFAPFSDDASRSRDTAFAKIRARVAGTALAAETLGVA